MHGKLSYHYAHITARILLKSQFLLDFSSPLRAACVALTRFVTVAETGVSSLGRKLVHQVDCLGGETVGAVFGLIEGERLARVGGGRC